MGTIQEMRGVKLFVLSVYIHSLSTKSASISMCVLSVFTPKLSGAVFSGHVLRQKHEHSHEGFQLVLSIYHSPLEFSSAMGGGPGLLAPLIRAPEPLHTNGAS